MLLFIILMGLISPILQAETPKNQGKIPPTQRAIAEGRHQYMMRCARCHGEKGDGNGPLADLLDPRPRDFTLGMFKFRTTRTGALPTDEDLFRTITRGIPGTEMPSWEGLPVELRWAVLYYIKTFSEDFSDPELDPYKFVVTLPPKVPSSPGSIAKGKQLYEKNKCWECHGREARGDGRTNLKDDWEFPIRVPNLTRQWNLKGGSSPEQIVYRFTTGLNGSPMPSYEDSINGEDRWHLANYIASIAESGFRRETIFKAKLISADIPLDVNAKVWSDMAATRIFIQDQSHVVPYWINNAVDMLDVRAVYNEHEIGFLIEWDDPAQDVEHHEEKEVTSFQDQYVLVGEIPRQPGVFRDSIALQFPVKPGLDQEMNTLRGSSANPQNLWVWKSDQASVEETNGYGLRVPLKRQSGDSHGVHSKASWRDGRWRLVLKRTLQTSDKNDVQFAKDRIIPIAFNVWDGSNGEHGMIMGLSSWYLLYLDDPASDIFGRMRDALWFYGISREATLQ
jgi:mono/diheme cytochrome c family protein